MKGTKGGRAWHWTLRNNMKRSTVTAFIGSVTGNRQRILPRKPFCDGLQATHIGIPGRYFSIYIPSPVTSVPMSFVDPATDR